MAQIVYILKNRLTLFIRVYHLVFTILVSTIIFTGLYRHSPPSNGLLNFAIISALHNFCGFMLSFLLMIRAYYAWTNREFSEIIFTWHDIYELPSLFKYYLFFSDIKPAKTIYNAGQRLMYTLWYVLLSLANISGAIAYKKTHFLTVAKLIGGLHHVDWVVLSASFILSFTIPLHVYLVVTEDNNFFQSMLTGWSASIKPGSTPPVIADEHKLQTRLPGKWLLDKLRAKK